MNFRSISYQPKYSKYIFWISVLLLTYLYEFQHTLFYPPQSIHQFRQCDCLSIAENYYYGDMNFFKPELNNQLSEEGKSGYAVGEFPLIYYLVAVLWKIFGYNMFVFRLVEILIVITGLYCLFRMTEDLLKDSFWALILTLLLLTSPIVVFYANNFLSNMPAFGLVLIGWYYFYRFVKKPTSVLLFVSLGFFMLAGLLKVSSAISLVLLFCLLLTEMTGLIRYKDGQKLFEKPKTQLIPFLLAFLLIFGWYAYAFWFNLTYKGAFTFNSVWPIWRMSRDEIAAVWEGFTQLMMQQIFDLKLLALTGLMFVALVIMAFFKKIALPHFVALLILLAGSILYSLFWFNAFGNHDYYLIDLLILLIAVWLLFARSLKKSWERAFGSIWLKIFLLLLLGFNVLYCQNNMRMRYWMMLDKPERFTSELEVSIWAWHHKNYVDQFEAFTSLPYYFEAIGVRAEDKVISLPDKSINISLVLMHKKGWTAYALDEKTQGDRIAKLMRLGAKYLLLSDKVMYQDQSLQPYLKNKMGSYQNIDIYDLRSL